MCGRRRGGTGVEVCEGSRVLRLLVALLGSVTTVGEMGI